MTHRKVLDIEELKKVFRIVDGKLERLDRRMSVPKWKEVENKANQSKGYCKVSVNGRTYRYHAILWTLQHSENIQEGLEIDHINGNKIDNRIENLRIVTPRENCQNRIVHHNGKLAGSSYRRDRGKYVAEIQISDKHIKLGSYKTENEAHEAYEIACKHVNDYVDNESFRAIIKDILYGDSRERPAISGL